MTAIPTFTASTPLPAATLTQLVTALLELRALDWSRARQFFEVPSVAIDAGNDKVDLTWPLSKGCQISGNWLASAGSWSFAAQPTGTYYLMLSTAGAFSAATTLDPAKLHVGTVTWTLATTTLSGLSLSALATVAGYEFAGVGGAGGTQIVPRGAWASGYAYTGTAAQIDVVQHGGATYWAIASAVSGASTEPGVGASWETVWMLASAKGATGATGATGAGITPKGTWVDTTPYIVGDAVLGTDGNGYVCKADHTAATGNRPITGGSYATYWTLYVAKGDTGSTGATGTGYRGRGAWSNAGVSYVCSATYIDTVRHKYTTWKCILSNTSADASEPGTGVDWATYWEAMIEAAADGATLIWEDEWATTTLYHVGDIIYHAGSSFRCTSEHTSGATTEPDTGVDWETVWYPVARKGDTGAAGAKGDTGDAGTNGTNGTPGLDGVSVSWGGAYDAGTTYPLNANVTYNGWQFTSLQAANVGNTPDITGDTAWWGRGVRDGTPGAAGGGDVHWIEPVISQQGFPDTFSEGDRFIVMVGSSGAWTGHDDEIAEYTSGDWVFTMPLDGMAVVTTVSQLAILIYNTASGWALPPGTGGTPADTVADQDGTGAAGASTEYSRGDHKHADTARHAREHAMTSTDDHAPATGGDKGKYVRMDPTSGEPTYVDLPAASDSVAGIAEYATTAEATTGTSTNRTLTPDALRGSDYGKRDVIFQWLAPATALATGDGKAKWRVPSLFNGWNVVAVFAGNGAANSSSGAVTLMFRRVRSATPADMLSTALTIDASEDDSSTAAAAAVIDGAADDLATGDYIYIDVDGAGTGTQGTEAHFIIQKPGA